MVTYDETAAVFEAWADKNCAEYLGAFDTYAEACDAVKKHRELAARRVKPAKL